MAATKWKRRIDSSFSEKITSPIDIFCIFSVFKKCNIGFTYENEQQKYALHSHSLGSSKSYSIQTR